MGQYYYPLLRYFFLSATVCNPGSGILVYNANITPMSHVFTVWASRNQAGSSIINRTNDPSTWLTTYRLIPDESTAELTLNRMLIEQIEPLVRRILEHEALLDELLGTILARIVERLRAERRTTSLAPIEDLESYVAVVTHLAVDGHLRNQYPERARLKNRLRYLFRNAPDLALWEQQGRFVCGKSVWQREARKAIAIDSALVEQEGTEDLRRLCHFLLSRYNAPIALNDLTHAIATAQAMDKEVTSLSDVIHTDFHLERHLQQKSFLEHLWREVKLLPERQIAALLLNLRDTGGRGILELLPALAIASKAQIAQAMGWSERQLDPLWEYLPIDDNRIAELLSLKRQQIINLRKVARERLERRMRSWEGEAP